MRQKILTICSFSRMLLSKMFNFWRFTPYCENDHPAFHQHFGSDVTSASFELYWSRGCGAILTHAVRRYALDANMEQVLILFDISTKVLVKCHNYTLYNIQRAWHRSWLWWPMFYHCRIICCLFQMFPTDSCMCWVVMVHIRNVNNNMWPSTTKWDILKVGIKI